MAKQSSGGTVLNFVAWLTGILVSLAVGFGMVDGTLIIRWIPVGVTTVVGWVVVITSVISAVLAIIKQ